MGRSFYDPTREWHDDEEDYMTPEERVIGPREDDAADCECAGSSLHGIKMCPLHKAAPLLLAALEYALPAIAVPKAFEKARHAISAAKGESNG